MNRKSVIRTLLAFFIPVLLCASPENDLTESEDQGKKQVIVFHAGSLAVPFSEIEKNFEAAYPDIDVIRESGPSRELARMISEKNKPADLMASADYQDIDTLLIPGYASWNIKFATNQIVLCYMGNSRYSPEINADNWYNILGRKDISWGHTDPNLDPCGNRSLMTIKLAEIYYKQSGLYDKLISNRREGNVFNSAKAMVDVLLLGKIDYVWEYLSVAVQYKLKYITLPDQINLGNYLQDNYYRQATLKVTGKDPGTEITLTASSITYGITMIKTAPHPGETALFLQFLLDPLKGLKTLKDMGQPPLVPARIDTDEKLKLLPVGLRKFVEVK